MVKCIDVVCGIGMGGFGGEKWLGVVLRNANYSDDIGRKLDENGSFRRLNRIDRVDE